MARSIERRVAAIAVLASLAACNAVLGIEPPNDVVNGVPDAGADVIADAGVDVMTTGEDASDATTNPFYPYADIRDAGRWQSVEIPGAGSGFAGGVFDGRFVYAVPATSGALVRYDTYGTFVGTDWSSTPVGDGGSHSLMGAIFGGGEYPAMIPTDDRVAQFHVGASFTTPMTFVALSTMNPGAVGYCGGVSTDRPPGGFSKMLIPSVDANGNGHGLVAFDNSPWKFHDLTTRHPSAVGFCGGVFDGRYVYFVPYRGGARIAGGYVRYDTDMGFTDEGAWAFQDVGVVGSGAAGFFGGVFDGHYVYYVPNLDSTVVRFDTHEADFTKTGAWNRFDLIGKGVHPNARGFKGGAFDGRYVYLVPNGSEAGLPPVVRFDTQGDFESASAWSTFDPKLADARAAGFLGAAFDGRYVYLIPSENRVALRFKARDTPEIPAGFAWGSFF